MDHETAGQSTAASLPIVKAAAETEAEANGTKTTARTATATITTTATATTPPTSLAPGFRFHPTDEELINYYLKRQVSKKPVRFNAIGEVDIYKNEPWDLAGYSRLKSKDQEWYFFCAMDKKYGNHGARMNRTTAKGYWKATGKEREVRNDSQLIGMKKILVFYTGRGPNSQRTNWVMHECRLIEAEFEKHATSQEAYVVCRIFHKNNKGPPIGNQYAPFIEEERDDGEAAIVPGVDAVDEVAPVDDAYPERNNVEQDTQSIYTGPLSGNNGPAGETQNLNNEPPSASQNLLPVNNEPPIEAQNLPPVNNELHSETQNFNNEPPSETRNHLPVNNEPPSETGDLLPVCESERVEDVTPQAPFPLHQYKRRRHNDSSSNHSNASENSTKATQDLFSSTTTVAATMATTASTSMASATTMPISPLLEFLLMESLEPKESNDVCQPTFKTANLDSSVPPSISKFINDLQKEVHKLSAERETLKLEMKSAHARINILQSRLDFLSNENENLKRIHA